MLSSFDDYPIHQTSRPVLHTATADLNHYDRYFFNGYVTVGDGSPPPLFFAVAMGLYPNRHVVDAAFSVVRDGVEQVSVDASRRAPWDRADANRVGPIEVIVVEPLRRHRILVDAPEQGLRADLEFTARSSPIEEPHFRRLSGVRVVFDYTRLTQFGSWTGWIEIDGQRHVVTPDTCPGSRDRSWGVRPVGERSPTGAPVEDPQFFWLWAPIVFPGFSTHLDVNEESDGTRWHQTAVIAPDGDGEPIHLEQLSYRMEWRAGTRRVAWFEAVLGPPEHSWTVQLAPLFDFQMLGLGYLHPSRGHGVWRGESDVTGDRWALPVEDALAPQHLHIQTICRATCTDPSGRVHRGTGVLEQLVIGPHSPTGLSGLFDGIDDHSQRSRDHL